MKHPSIKWAVVVLGVLVLLGAMLASLPHVQSRSVQADASAEQIGGLLQSVTEQYREQDAKAAPHRHIIAEQEAALAPIQSKMDELAEGAAGLDHTLCKLYGLRYIRAANGSIGTFHEVSKEECDPLQ